jgi:peptidoglycan hydrolase CwlO-like protein
MKKYILPVILLLILLWLAFDKVTNIGLSSEFKAKQDSLVHAVDSMKLDIAKDDAVIDSLNQIDSDLTYKLDHQKAKVIKIKEEMYFT